MLKLWVFIMVIEGQAPLTFESATEAKCKEGMAKLMMVERLQKHKATGACYVRTTDVEDTQAPYIVNPESR